MRITTKDLMVIRPTTRAAAIAQGRDYAQTLALRSRGLR